MGASSSTSSASTSSVSTSTDSTSTFSASTSSVSRYTTNYLSSALSAYPQFSLDEIKKATNNFNQKNILRYNEYWNEYLVEISSNDGNERSRAAVKHFKPDANNQFGKEIEMLTEIQEHANVSTLLGYCMESGEKLLVYKYMENGNLCDYVIFNSSILLSWKKRLNICIGIAYGLRHLHKRTSEFRNGIVHGGMNPASILLDENWDAIVSDFERSQISGGTTVKGTALTQETDIYDFGIILFQLLCRKLPSELDRCSLDESEDLGVWAKQNVDAKIESAIAYESLKAFTNAIKRCLQPDPERSSYFMDFLVQDLETALNCQEDEDERILNVQLNALPRESRIMEGVRGSDSTSTDNSTLSLSSALFAYRQFTLDEIKEATNYFDEKRVVKRKDYCTHYLAKFPSNNNDVNSTNGAEVRTLAEVQHFNENCDDQFENEIHLLTKIQQHPNFVPLLGYCIDESGEKFLIYKYMENGRLSDYVQEHSSIILSWKKRLTICLGVAQGMQHIHKGTGTFRNATHGLLDADKVLLDESWVPKLLLGTFPSLPERKKGHDICTLGNMLSHVLHRTYNYEGQSSRDLRWSRPEEDIEIRSVISDDCFKAFTYLIQRCKQHPPDARPSIDRVVQDLETAINCQEGEGEPILNVHIDASLRNGRKSSITTTTKSVSSLSSSSSCRQFSLDSIKEATNNFDIKRVIWRDWDQGYWKEYVAEMYDLNSRTKKTRVVVRQYDSTLTSFDDVSFENDIRKQTYIQVHPNLVSLLGYCMESGERILIYEYFENARLSGYVDIKSCIRLSWKKRLTICLGAAYGLQHLHSETGQLFPKGIIHRQVNPTNILLDKNWVAKLSYSGYLAYESSSIDNIGDDIYSFGFILFQVLCGRSTSNLEKSIEYDNLGDWAQQNVDRQIKAGIADDSLKAFIDAMRKCLNRYGFGRNCPSMDDVVLYLERALKCQKVEGEPIYNNRLNAPRKWSMMGGVTNSAFSLSSLCREFSLAEIKEATNNFDKERVLGEGGEGTVYLAEIYLNSKTEKTGVAVKHLNTNCTDEFEKEIQTVTNIQHPNLVSLLGYTSSNESDDKILIYEYMGKGSLSDYVKKDSAVCLSWKQRLNICLGAAYGLQHLHKETKDLPKGIIHRDVKPGNILLDHNWVAKVSDFGMFKLSEAAQTKSIIMTGAIRGTPGYLPPESYRSFELTRKVDVYAFGVVMFEVLCRNKPLDRGDVSYYPQENEDLGLWAKQNVDFQIEDQISQESLEVFTNIIGASLRHDPDARPSMDEVVRDLEAVLKYQEQEQ